jgi:hypothetical protein
MPAARVLRLLQQAAGHHLNSEAVDAFVSMVELLPVGVHVRVSGGPYDGSYGIVLACFASAPNRPLIRLLFDRNGQPLPEDMEVDLRHEPGGVDLTAVPEAGVSLEEYARRLALAHA